MSFFIVCINESQRCIVCTPTFFKISSYFKNSFSHPENKVISSVTFVSTAIVFCRGVKSERRQTVLIRRPFNTTYRWRWRHGCTRERNKPFLCISFFALADCNTKLHLKHQILWGRCAASIIDELGWVWRFGDSLRFTATPEKKREVKVLDILSHGVGCYAVPPTL